MTALPSKPFLLGLPRATRLFRTLPLELLVAMPAIDLDVALATLWKRIEAAHRMPPYIREPGAAGKLACIAECVRVLDVAALTPVPVTAEQKRAAQFHADMYEREHAAKVDFVEQLAAADAEQARADHEAELADWRDGTTAHSLADSFRDPPTHEES